VQHNAHLDLAHRCDGLPMGTATEPLTRPLQHLSKDTVMAKGQKKSNKEVRKPKAEKPKTVAAPPSFLTPPPKKK
jgi:hypothetical protein